LGEGKEGEGEKGESKEMEGKGEGGRGRRDYLQIVIYFGHFSRRSYIIDE
jgi:hypothetical protein